MRPTAARRDLSGEVWEFTRSEVVPEADKWDRQQAVPREAVAGLAARGWLGALIAPEYGGSALDAVSFATLNEAIGYGCSSLRSVLTVHSMVSQAISRWASPAVRAEWLPLLATGERVGAFALTEPEAGSDADQVATTAVVIPDGYLLTGIKHWITYGQRADVFLVFARCQDKVSAFLVPRDSTGLTVVPITGALGTRAALLAELRLRDCAVPAEALVGRIGFGLTAVATSALEVGRHSVASGCVGLAQFCLDLAVTHTKRRKQFGKPIAEHQLVQRMITDMATGVTAARLLCRHAGELRDRHDQGALAATWMAKYFASRTAFRSASDVVQVHGAAGCASGHPAQRMLRDAKIMEIIEGSTEIQQTIIAQIYCQNVKGVAGDRR